MECQTIETAEAQRPIPAAPPRSCLASALRGLGWIAAALLVPTAVAWTCLVLHYCLPFPAPVRTSVALAVPALLLAVLWRSPRLLTAAVSGLAAFGLGLAVFLAQVPSHDRDWVSETSVMPWAEIDGDRIVLHGIRSNRYRSETDFDLVHRDEVFDLARLTDVDLCHVYWGSPLIAHTMFSFGFDDGRRVCLSVETRREQGEQYDAIKGFFRQFELIYVWGDETDLVRLRTDHRGEQVYVYRLNLPIDRMRLVLLECLKTTNALHERAQWYNAIAHNCTTTLLGHTRPIVNPDAVFDWRWLANGLMHEVMHERGTIDRSIPLEELRRRSLVNGRVPAEVEGVEYSRRLREP